MSPTLRRTLLWTAITAVVFAGAYWIWRTRAQSAATSTMAADMPGMDMPGMPGMNMGSDSSVVLTADQIRTFSVTFGEAAVRTMSNVVRAAGTVVVDETGMVQVAARVGGFVEKLHVNVTGQSVRRGQPLLELYSPELLAAQQELLLAADLQRRILGSNVPGVPVETVDLVSAAKQRFNLWDISEEQVEEILRTGRTRRTMTLFAPASGVVTERSVVQGQAIQAGDMLYAIADFSRVWVEAQLRGVDAANVRVGTRAEIDITGLTGRSFSGRVEYVYPTVEQDARTVRARIVVANGAGTLKPGMYATVLLTSSAREALTVPASSVIRTGERNFLFIDLGGGRLRPQDVQIGVTSGDDTEILSGIEAGQRVVTSAQYLLNSESNLGEVMRSMIGMGGATQASGGAMEGMDMTGIATPKESGATRAPDSVPPRQRR